MMVIPGRTNFDVRKRVGTCQTCGRTQENLVLEQREKHEVWTCARCTAWNRKATDGAPLKCAICGKRCGREDMTQDGPICHPCLRANMHARQVVGMSNG